MNLNFRSATQNDLSIIIAMLTDDALGSGRESTDLSQYQKAFAAIEADPNQELTVAEYNGEVVGTFQLSFIQYLAYGGGLRAQIEAVRVAKSRRGKGIGKLIFNHSIKRAKNKGAHLLQLTTDKKRPDAIVFYKGLGFVSSHEGMKLHF